MWLSGQQKRAPVRDLGQTGPVTMTGEELAVQLDSEIRRPEVYGPAGYHWSPGLGDRVLVIKGEGEPPCVAGVKDGGSPAAVTIRAGTVELQGSVLINGAALEDYIRQVVEGKS